MADCSPGCCSSGISLLKFVFRHHIRSEAVATQYRAVSRSTSNAFITEANRSVEENFRMLIHRVFQLRPFEDADQFIGRINCEKFLTVWVIRYSSPCRRIPSMNSQAYDSRCSSFRIAEFWCDSRTFLARDFIPKPKTRTFRRSCYKFYMTKNRRAVAPFQVRQR